MAGESRNLRRMSKFQQMREAPDGGWGWVLVVGGMVALANWSAAMRCFSVFYVPLKLHYSTDFASVAWINGFYQIGYGVACVFGHVMIRQFGFRPLCMTTGTLAGFSIFAGSWATHLLQVQIFAGLIPGICMASVSMCSFTIVTRYFKKRLNLATQLLCAGLSLGSLACCPIYQWLIEIYGWRGALQIIGGFFLNIAVVGALMRPIVLREDFDPNFLKQCEKPKHVGGKNDANNNDEEKSGHITYKEFETNTLSDFDEELEIDEGSKSVEFSKGKREATRMERLAAFCRRVHLDIFLQPLFYMYTFGWVTFAMAYLSTLTYLVPFGLRTANLTPMQSSSLVSALMVGEVISRILHGLTFDRISTQKKIILSGSACLVMAAVFILVSLLRSYYALVIGCVVLGMSGGGMDGVYSVYIVDFFGVKSYAAVYGYGNIVIHSLGMATTVLTGKCVDATGKLESAFFIGSSAAVLSFFLCLLMRYFYLRKMKTVDKKASVCLS